MRGVFEHFVSDVWIVRIVEEIPLLQWIIIPVGKVALIIVCLVSLGKFQT